MTRKATNTTQDLAILAASKRIDELIKECVDHQDIKWVSGNGVTVTIRNMERSHIVNVIRKIHPKAILQIDYPYIHEFNESYYGRQYREWLTILSNEYKLRAAYEHYEMLVREKEWQSDDCYRRSYVQF